jgi:hypothetical protein
MDTLAFKLDLENTAFVRGLERAGASLNGFASKIGSFTGITAGIAGAVASFEGLANVTEGVKKVFEQGAGLEKLSRVTGESVRDIVKLQGGLRAVGIDTEATGGMMLKLQRALGGVNEMGEDIKSVFFAMGLDVKFLKSLDPQSQFLAIADALKGVGNESATVVASKIFGREGAQNFLELARSSDEFAQGMDAASGKAELMQRNAAAFEHFERTMTSIKGKGATMFTGIAEGALPAVQAVADAINRINLSVLGKNIGVVIGGFTESFREGRLVEIIAESVKMGFEVAVNFLPSVFEKIGVLLLKVFETPLTYMQAVIDWIIAKGQNFYATLSGGGKIESDFGVLLKERKEEGLRLGIGNGMSISELNKSANADWENSMAEAGKTFQEWFGKMSNLNDKLPRFTSPEETSLGTAKTLNLKQNQDKMDFTAFEKFGWVSGLGGRVSTPEQEVARNTREANQHLRTIASWGRGGVRNFTLTD